MLTSKIETHCSSTRKIKLAKSKKVIDKAESEKEEDGVDLYMNIERENNKGLFLTLTRRNTPTQTQDRPVIPIPSVLVFAAPQNLPALLIFVFLAKLQEVTLSTHRLKINLKWLGYLLRGSPIPKTAKALLGKDKMKSQVLDILKIVKKLTQIIKKQTIEI